MSRILQLSIKNYRSVKEEVRVCFPRNMPLVLLGENNTGKSNIVRALDLLLGESWPGSHELDDHEYFDGNRANVPVEIRVDVEGVNHTFSNGSTRIVQSLLWKHTPEAEDRSPFRIVFDNGNEYFYVSSETRDQCSCIVVGADRRLSYQLSYTTKYTFLSKLMRKFHQALTSDLTRMERLSEEFEALKDIFEDVSSFSSFCDELKRQVQELSGNLEYCLGIDFSAYDPSNFFHSLHVHPFKGERVLNFEELGTGQEQILAMSFAYAYAKAFHGQSGGLILVVEEPEAHLHPLAQQWIAYKIDQLCREGIQVIITTHSPHLVNIMNLEGLVLLSKKENGATATRQLKVANLVDYCREHGAARANEANVLSFYTAAATNEILSGLFARKIVLVEGPSEALALPVYFSRLGLNVTQDGVAVISVQGKGNISKWWRLFTAYGIPTYVIFDNDLREEDAEKNTRQTMDILNTLGLQEEIETLVAESAIQIEDKFAVFGKNLESTLRGYFGREYTELEGEAEASYGLSETHSKPLVARFVAERINGEDRGWELLRGLAEKVRGLVAVSLSSGQS